jgi:hypothetical protein
MKIVTYFILLINLIALILTKFKKSRTNSKTKALRKSKSKSQWFLRRPFHHFRRVYGPGFHRPSFTIVRRSPIVLSEPSLIPLSDYLECQMNLGQKILAGKSSGHCRSPCTVNSCIQLSYECCIYGNPA